jgi:hypothetical protein
VRLDLPGGGWADLRERLLYAQARPVREVMARAATDKAALVDLDMALVRAYVEAWEVMDPQGRPVSLDAPETAPDDVIQEISMAALPLWNGKPDPKGGPRRSPTPRSARR